MSRTITKLREAAETARNAIATVGDRTDRVTFTIGGITAVVLGPKAAPEVPPGPCEPPNPCRKPGRCLGHASETHRAR